jgi:flagellar export protein FliJ
VKSLKTLIKLHKKELDDLLSRINALENQKDELCLFLQNLEVEATRELEYYAGTEYAFMLGKYLENVEINRKHLISQITQVTGQIKLLRNQLHDKFAELKKFEIALQNRLNKEQNEIKKAETKLLDEINTNKFAFNKNNGA